MSNPTSTSQTTSHAKRALHTESDHSDAKEEKKKSKKKPKKRHGACDGALVDRLLDERKEWLATTKLILDRVEVLSGAVASAGAGASAAALTATTTHTAPSDGDQQEPRPTVPVNHPLHAFVNECLVQTDWDARVGCGVVRRRYVDWWAELQHQEEAETVMNHITFSREMRKYFPRQGCSARCYYVGLELVVPANSDHDDVDVEEECEGV
jgi:hypothetical protein